MPKAFKDKALLSVIVIEENNQFSSPARLIKALESISNLYSVIATIEDENENELIVLACDSGSDKSFDFLGLAKITEQVKDLIIAIWDRRVFYRQKLASENLSLVAESLPILEKINQLCLDGSLEREQAEMLKRQTILGATQFLEAGLTIPELEAVSSHNPRQLMKPEPKLLVSPNAEEEDVGNGADLEAGKIIEGKQDLTEEEIGLLDKVLRKAKSYRKTKNGTSEQTEKPEEDIE